MEIGSRKPGVGFAAQWTGYLGRKPNEAGRQGNTADLEKKEKKKKEEALHAGNASSALLSLRETVGCPVPRGRGPVAMVWMTPA